MEYTDQKIMNTKFGNEPQKGFTLLYKNPQGGKTGHAIAYMEKNKKYFCIYITSNSTQLLEQTATRIEDKFGSKAFRIDGNSKETARYNEDIFSILPEKVETLRGKVCCLIKNTCNLKRLSVILYLIDKYNTVHPTNQVHCKLIADEADKTISLSDNVIENGEFVAEFIDKSFRTNRDLRSRKEELPRGEKYWIDYIFSVNLHKCLIEILGLTATTSNLFRNAGIKRVFGGQDDDLKFNTMVKENSRLYRNVNKWDTAEIEDKLGLENSVTEIMKIVKKQYKHKWYIFVPAKQYNITHLKVVSVILESMKRKRNQTMVVTSNQYGIVGHMLNKEGDIFTVKHTIKSSIVSHQIADLVETYGIKYLGATGLASLGRGITIQASKLELGKHGIECKSSLLVNGLVMTCIGAHNQLNVSKKLGMNSILVQRLSRGCTYIRPELAPLLIAPTRILKLFSDECKFEETRMNEGRSTGITSLSNYDLVKGVMTKEFNDRTDSNLLVPGTVTKEIYDIFVRIEAWMSAAEVWDAYTDWGERGVGGVTPSQTVKTRVRDLYAAGYFARKRGSDGVYVYNIKNKK